MSRILVSGSIAFDTIMNFHDEFGKYILPEKTHMLSVSFNINELVRHPGGAGHNIAYSIGLLGDDPVLVGAVGNDFKKPEHVADLIDYTYVAKSISKKTAAGHVITDNNNNQIWAFYPGALGQLIEPSIHDIVKKEDITMAIVGPNHPDTMQKHVKECHELGIPVFFDPGQPLTAFSKDQLHGMMKFATYLVVNEYEKDLFCKIAEVSFEEVKEAFERVIVTLGANGSVCYHKDEEILATAESVDNVVDPTGAGDAWRAGLLYGLKHGKDRKEAMELGSTVSAACIQCSGTMEHDLP